MPDLVRLIGRLASDRSLPRGIRIRLWLLVAYRGSPFDLVPDVIPVAGYAGNVILVTATLRPVIRRAGHEAVQRHWPGSADGLQTLHRLTGG